MNYTTMTEFGNEICISVMETMGNDYEAVYKEVSKNNGVCLHSIMISSKGSNVAPTSYIDELYEDYIHGRAFGDIISDILNVYKNNAKEINMDMSFFTRYDGVKDRILYKLINWESNIKLLKEIPHVKWNDLAIVFYYSLADMRFGNATILIRNSHLTMWGIDSDTLYKDAKENMLRLQPEDIISIGQVIQDIVLHCNNSHVDVTAVGFLQGEEAMRKVGEQGQGPVMYVLSSKDKYFGAAVLLYSQSLKMLSEKLNRNLIILPSSVHEVLLVPDDPATGTAHYKDMVKDVNDTQLEPEEILSYNVYYYNRFSGQINIIQ